MWNTPQGKAHKKKSDYSSDDIDHTRRVVSYVHRHQSQKPEGDVKNSNWRRSLAYRHED